jgi:hypothetical protein
MAKRNKKGQVIGDTRVFRDALIDSNLLGNQYTIFNDARQDGQRRLKAYGAGRNITANQVGMLYAACKRAFGYRFQRLDIDFSVKIHLTDWGVV